MAWRLATSPTRTSPDFENPTTDGVVRPPSALGMTTGSPASKTLTTELVVPRSIPTALGIVLPPYTLLSRWLSPGNSCLLCLLDSDQYSDLEWVPVNLSEEREFLPTPFDTGDHVRAPGR